MKRRATRVRHILGLRHVHIHLYIYVCIYIDIFIFSTLYSSRESGYDIRIHVYKSRVRIRVYATRNFTILLWIHHASANYV